MKIVTLTDEEIIAVRNMLDVALRQLGGRAAQTYLVLDQKFAEATSADGRAPTIEPPEPS